MALAMTTNTGDSEPERSTTKTPCRNAYITAYTTAEIAQTFRRRVPPRRTPVFGTRNALTRFIAALVLGGTNSGVKYSRKKAYRTTIEASIQISGASVTNQSSTTSVRISRRTSPNSANKSANSKIESSSQMIRDRIPVRNESRGKEVSEQRNKSIIPIARWGGRGGSQAWTTAPDLRSGLAGVHGFKSLARTARGGKSHPPHCVRPRELRITENLYPEIPARRAGGRDHVWYIQNDTLSGARTCDRRLQPGSAGAGGDVLHRTPPIEGRAHHPLRQFHCTRGLGAGSKQHYRARTDPHGPAG